MIAITTTNAIVITAAIIIVIVNISICFMGFHGFRCHFRSVECFMSDFFQFPFNEKSSDQSIISNTLNYKIQLIHCKTNVYQIHSNIIRKYVFKPLFKPFFKS